MKYEKAIATVVEFENEDVVTTSFVPAAEACGFTQFDAEYCDGQTQAVSKSQFGF